MSTLDITKNTYYINSIHKCKMIMQSEIPCATFIFFWLILVITVPHLPENEQKYVALSIFGIYMFLMCCLLVVLAYNVYYGTMPTFISGVPEAKVIQDHIIVLNPDKISVAIECGASKDNES